MRAVLKSVRDDLQDGDVWRTSEDLGRFLDAARDMVKMAQLVANTNKYVDVDDFTKGRRFVDDQIDRLEVLYKLHEWGNEGSGLSEMTLMFICRKIMKVWRITRSALITLMDEATKEVI